MTDELGLFIAVVIIPALMVLLIWHADIQAGKMFDDWDEE